MSSENSGIMRYFSHCNTEWEDEWSCACNDDCPVCGREIEPYDYKQVGPVIEDGILIKEAS